MGGFKWKIEGHDDKLYWGHEVKVTNFEGKGKKFHKNIQKM